MKKNNLLTTNAILSAILNVKGVYEYILLLGNNGYKFDYEKIIKNNKESLEIILNSKKSKLLIAKNFLKSLLPGFSVYMSKKGKNIDKISKDEYIIPMNFEEIKYYQQIQSNLDKIIFVIMISCSKEINPKDVFEFTEKIKENIKDKTFSIQSNMDSENMLIFKKRNNDKKK